MGSDIVSAQVLKHELREDPMNRILSWPETPIVPGLFEAVRNERHETVVNDKGMICLESPLGPVEMKFSQPDQQLSPGTVVYVWWKASGFVCAPSRELDQEESESRRIAESLAEARSHLAEARRERQARLAGNVDIVLPDEVDEPLHAAR
ncbi:hypothetical protein [Piscinibacter sp. XHJ-5]|uniref:hypothetical protein n=1 Tax=Piscinibacter sp. XHJ-5 TaxID=3037797 RepID=UPI002452FDC0|nr:hypothetical protein [Piscinibacter sp. XHJ-5]